MAAATTEHSMIGHMTGPPATMISHMARHDTVRARRCPRGLSPRPRAATSAGSGAASALDRDRAGTRGNRTRTAPCSAVDEHRRARRAPARDDVAPRHAPAVAEACRGDAVARRHGRDQCRRDDRAASMVRQQYDVRRDRLLQHFRLGRLLRIGEQQGATRPRPARALRTSGRCRRRRHPLADAAPRMHAVPAPRSPRRHDLADRLRASPARRRCASGIAASRSAPPAWSWSGDSRRAGRCGGCRARAGMAAAKRAPRRRRRARPGPVSKTRTCGCVSTTAASPWPTSSTVSGQPPAARLPAAPRHSDAANTARGHRAVPRRQASSATRSATPTAATSTAGCAAGAQLANSPGRRAIRERPGAVERRREHAARRPRRHLAGDTAAPVPDSTHRQQQGAEDGIATALASGATSDTRPKRESPARASAARESRSGRAQRRRIRARQPRRATQRRGAPRSPRRTARSRPRPWQRVESPPARAAARSRRGRAARCAACTRSDATSATIASVRSAGSDAPASQAYAPVTRPAR